MDGRERRTETTEQGQRRNLDRPAAFSAAVRDFVRSLEAPR